MARRSRWLLMIAVGVFLMVLGSPAYAGENQAPAPNSQARIALHAGPQFFPSKNMPTICDSAPPAYCLSFNHSRPPGGSVVYMFLVNFNYAKGVTFGIEYCGYSGRGVDPAYSLWSSCGSGTEEYLTGDHGPWPAPGSGIRITWDECITGSDPVCGDWRFAPETFLGALYVYAYSPDLLEAGTAPTDSGQVFGVITCNGDQQDLLAETGYPIERNTDAISLGMVPGARGCPLLEPPCFGQPGPSGPPSPSAGPCDFLPVLNTTWGLLKNRYPLKPSGDRN